MTAKQLKIIIAAYSQIIWQHDNVFDVSLIGEHLNTDNQLPPPSPVLTLERTVSEIEPQTSHNRNNFGNQH